MKTYNFLLVLILLCLSAKAQEEFLAPTNEEALSALQEALPILNKYNLITNGEEWFLAEEDAVSAINEHNRTAFQQNKIISDNSYERNHGLIFGLPPDPYKVYGDKWFNMQDRIAHTFLKDVGLLIKLNNRANTVFRDEYWRFLTTPEAVLAINEHNQTADPENKITSDTSYERNFRRIPGLPKHLKYQSSHLNHIYWYYPNKKRVTSQIIGWMDGSTSRTGNKILVDGHWRFLTEKEAVTAINRHNQTADEEKKILSDTSYERNYKLIPGLPRIIIDHYPSKRRITSQIIGWINSEDLHGNKVLVDGLWRFLTDTEAIFAINKHNRTANKENKITSHNSYIRNYRLIPGLPSHLEYYPIERMASQITDWINNARKDLEGPRGNKILVNGRWRFLTDAEAISAINKHNQTADEEKKILSLTSQRKNYKLIPGLPRTLNVNVTAQIIGWHGALGDKVLLVDGYYLILNEQEAVSAMNEHNRTAPVEKKILSPMSYSENHGLIPGLPPKPWIHYGLHRWKSMLREIYFDYYDNHHSRCKALLFRTP